MTVVIIITILLLLINNNNNDNNNNHHHHHLPETRKYWVDVPRGIVSSHGEKDPL